MKKLKKVNEVLEEIDYELPTSFVKTLEKQEKRVNKKLLRKIQKTYE